MASSEWIEIYRSYSAEELAEEIADLKLQLKRASGINSQGIGSKSYQRDLLHLQNRLHAAIRVQRLGSITSQRDSNMWGIPDASGVNIS